jgi:hypothetical protein
MKRPNSGWKMGSGLTLTAGISTRTEVDEGTGKRTWKGGRAGGYGEEEEGNKDDDEVDDGEANLSACRS